MELMGFLNGEYLPISECKISVMDIGITNGASVTDFVRTFNQKIFKLEEHVSRFCKGAKNAYLTMPYTEEEICEISRKLIELNKEVYPECEFGMCYYVTPGVNMTYAGSALSSGPLTPTYCQHVFPLPLSAWAGCYTEGIRMVTAPIPHHPAQVVPPKGKNRNRLHMWIGDHIVHSMDPGVMAIYLDMNGNIAETGGSNFVIYTDGKIVSPRNRNILWGISLQTVKEIVTEMGIPFVEDDITIYDVVNADEAWVTTSPYCLAPVCQFNGQTIGDGVNYPLFRKVLSAWGDMVGKDLWKELTEAEPINYR